MPILLHQTRSVRVTITPAYDEATIFDPGIDQRTIVIENMEGNNGPEIAMSCTRTMDDALGELSLTIYNLPIEVRGAIEAAQTRKVDDIDQILARTGKANGWQVFEDVTTGPEDATSVGLPTILVEAGYDGSVSRVFEAVGVRMKSDRPDGLTYETEITGIESIDAALYGRPETVFPEGSPTYDVMNFLRQGCGLGKGNATPDVWASLLGESRLDSPYYSASTGGFEALSELLNFLPLRWFVDDRELWIVAKDGQPGAAQPYINEVIELTEPLTMRPVRLEGGFVGIQTTLLPTATPGRLTWLTPEFLGLGFAPDASAIARAEVPPGVYRFEQVDHEFSTAADGDALTTMRLKPIQALTQLNSFQLQRISG